MASRYTSLLSLPPELILEVADHLPLDGTVALKLSHRLLNNSLPLTPRLRNQTPSHCARLAVRSYLAKPSQTHLRCILCKAVYPLKSFQSSSSPNCRSSSPETNAQDVKVVELPPRLCAWHIGRLVRIVRTEPSGRNEWVDSCEEMCMHCGAIQAWAKCECQCDSCGFWDVTAYTRFLNNDVECKWYVFYRKVEERGVSPSRKAGGSHLFVRETCSDRGTYVNMVPVSTGG
jgi:hypothetical protein